MAKPHKYRCWSDEEKRSVYCQTQMPAFFSSARRRPKLANRAVWQQYKLSKMFIGSMPVDTRRGNGAMTLKGRVGRHTKFGGKQCMNWVEDQKYVTDLLNAIPEPHGGSGGKLKPVFRAGIADNALYAAIVKFENKHFPNQNSGYIDPVGGMMLLMERLLHSIMAPTTKQFSPPPRNSPPTAENVKRLDDWLTSLMVGHAGAKEAWTFYEELDNYAGPFGDNGYPLGYGKKYCVLFNGNQKLNSDPTGRAWVRRTTVLLQLYLKNFIVTRYKAGNLASLTEPELRQAAFQSHPEAYTKGGLTLVVMLSPTLLPEISSIPSAEFVNENWQSSLSQVMETGAMVAPQLAGNSLAGLAGPAHTGLFQIAMRRDQQALSQRLNLSRTLVNIEDGIKRGDADRIVWLSKAVANINQLEFPDEGLVKYSGKVVETAKQRMHFIANRYRQEITKDPSLKADIDVLDPGWSQW